MNTRVTYDITIIGKRRKLNKLRISSRSTREIGNRLPPIVERGYNHADIGDGIAEAVSFIFAEMAGEMPVVSHQFDAAIRSHCILGVDPGLNRTGYAVLGRSTRTPILREGGVIQSTSTLTLAERILELGRGLREVIDEFKPQVLAIEQVFSTAQFPKTAILMAHARGALLYAAADAGIPVVHYTPTQVKRLLTGSGKASKEQIQHAIRQELGLAQVLEPNDVADAFAVALCHYHSSRAIVIG